MLLMGDEVRRSQRGNNNALLIGSMLPRLWVKPIVPSLARLWFCLSKLSTRLGAGFEHEGTEKTEILIFPSVVSV